jgi:hypothetical protein
MRFALAGLILALAVAALVLIARADPDSEEDPTAPSGHDPLRTELLMETPSAVVRTCRSAAAAARMPPHCPPAIPLADGAWGRARALDSDSCEYLVDLEPGTSSDASTGGPIFHLLFGGRCRRFDLTTNDRRWPTHGFFANNLRLVGVAPLEPGQSARADQPTPARPRVLGRTRIDDSPALLLSYPAHPLTTVHSGHLASVWNETQTGYAVSAHPRDPRTPRKERRAIKALRAMALAMHSH